MRNPVSLKGCWLDFALKDFRAHSERCSEGRPGAPGAGAAAESSLVMGNRCVWNLSRLVFELNIQIYRL